MIHVCSCGHDTPALDVREMAPRVRHPTIFETFDALPAGQAFVLVNDHDPKSLYDQFQAERPGAFGWRDLEKGPDVWRVEIWKRPRAASAEQTVAEVSRDTRALAVLQAMGINHCCGAHLSLAEAAPAAGVPLEKLLRALDTAVESPA